MPLPSRSIGHGLIDVFLAPTALFAALRERRWGWLAFALVALVQVAASYAFVGSMSTRWLVEQQLLQSASLSDQDLERMRPQLESMAPHMATFSAVGGVATLALTVMVLGSAYLLGGRTAGGPRYGWSTWLRLATWTQLPQALNALGLIVLARLASSPDQPLSLVGYASLNQLLLGLPPGHPWYTWTSSLSLFLLWGVALAAVGIRQWTDTSWRRAGLVAVLPYALVFGIWAALV